MSGEIELKPCPFCGGEAKISSYDGIRCTICLTEMPFRLGDRVGDIKEAWNRRTPEPGTSVVRWVRYDGTQETLPDTEKEVIIFNHDDRYICSGYFFSDEGKLWWLNMEYCFMSRVRIGDIWAHIPEPPEGMG